MRKGSGQDSTDDFKSGYVPSFNKVKGAYP